MFPTLLPDDQVVAMPAATGELHRGDVIVYKRDAHIQWIRRVVALPGDRIELRGHHAIVNGTPEQPREGPCRHDDVLGPPPDDVRKAGEWGPFVVPEGQYALFGDCRGNAIDARHIGFASRQDIVKRVSWIYFSQDSHGIRFDRIGQPVN